MCLKSRRPLFAPLDLFEDEYSSTRFPFTRRCQVLVLVSFVSRSWLLSGPEKISCRPCTLLQLCPNACERIRTGPDASQTTVGGLLASVLGASSPVPYGISN